MLTYQVVLEGINSEGIYAVPNLLLDEQAVRRF